MEMNQNFRKSLVRTLVSSVQYWQHCTFKSKLDLAEESGIWSIHHDRCSQACRTLYWTSAETRYFLEISVHANPGKPGKYALLIPPPGKGAQGKTRIYKLFLSGGYYAFVNPDE